MTLPIPVREPDSVPVLNATPFFAFTQSWQLKPPSDAVILIVKGTFDLTPGPAPIAEEQELPLGPTLFDGSDQALRYPGDMAFFKPRADVFVAGHVYGPTQGPAIRRAQIELGRELALTLAVIGDRRWERGAPGAPARFEKIELRPERAFGGPGFADNPIGIGRYAEEASMLPNFEWPDRLIRSFSDAPPPALSTPIPDTWPSRMRHAGTYGGSWLEKRAPYFPDDFSYEYFNAAPRYLQLAYPRGDERYRLAGFAPDDSIYEGTLPSLALRAFAQQLARPDVLTELTLNLDTVFFDIDARKLILLWRGAITSVDQYASDLASLFVLADPIGRRSELDEVRAQFRAAYDREHEPPEEAPLEAEATAQPPDNYVPPRGLTPSAARALGLPPWAATLSEPAPAALAPPPPEPTLTPSEIDALSPDASLAGVDLSYCDLRERDLSERDLREATLIGAKLDGARLSGADLRGAVLLGASLRGADLRGADLSSCELAETDLEGAKLDGASLNEASLRAARALGASFVDAKADAINASAADLTRAVFDRASLSEADFSSARLEEASFIGAMMDDVRLYDANASAMVADGAKARRLRADGARLCRASLVHLDAPGSSLRKVDLSDAILSEANFEDSVFEDALLDRANINQVEAKDCRWPRARASNATFVKSNLMGGYFEAVRFIECDLRGANLYGAERFRAEFLRCRFEHAIED